MQVAYTHEMLGGIEAGGTKFVCGIGNGPDDLETVKFPTTTPAVTLTEVVQFFRAKAGSNLQAVGIGSFGPVDIELSSQTYGFITSTPKLGWANFDLVGEITRALGVPAGFDTDVNAALLGEAKWGAAQGLTDAVYMTIGTGIGGGAMAGGRLVHGLVHPEMGHLRIPHDFVKDPYGGSCPYHGDCLEGLACGPAIQARWGRPGAELPFDHPAWDLESDYLAFAVMNLAVTLSPQRFILGGGVMSEPRLFEILRTKFSRLMNGYVRHIDILEHLDEYIQPPGLGGQAGILGSLVLASQQIS